METIAHIGSFLLAVCNNWAGYSTGGVVVAIVALWHSALNKSISKKLAITLALLFLFMASFKAWDDQFRSVQAAQHDLQSLQQKFDDLNKPKLSAEMEMVSAGDAKQIKGCLVLLNILIRNDGSPSIAHGWKLSVKSATVNVERISPTQIPDGFALNNAAGGTIAKFHANNRLEEKAMMSAIQKGLPIMGWLRFNLPGVTTPQFEEGEKTLYFRDVDDVESFIKFTKLGTLGRPEYYPGSGDDPFAGSFPDEKQ